MSDDGTGAAAVRVRITNESRDEDENNDRKNGRDDCTRDSGALGARGGLYTSQDYLIGVHDQRTQRGKTRTRRTHAAETTVENCYISLVFISQKEHAEEITTRLDDDDDYV